MNTTQIGTVTHYFPDLGIAAVDIVEPISLGDEIIFRLEGEDFIQTVEALEIDQQPVDPAPAGSSVGIHVHREIPLGTQVHRAA